jgi:hypothetical protein
MPYHEMEWATRSLKKKEEKKRIKNKDPGYCGEI